MGKIRGYFSGIRRASDGWMLARAPVSLAWTSVFQFSLSLYMCGLEKLGLVDRN